MALTPYVRPIVGGVASDEADRAALASWIETLLSGYSQSGHTQAVSTISDSGATGRALVQAATQAAARSALGLSSVAASGAYADLSGRPTLGTAAAAATTDFATSAQGTKADTAIQPGNSALSDSREWTGATVDQAEAEAGTATTRRAWTSLRVRQAVAAWWAASSAKAALDAATAAITALSTSLGALTTRVDRIAINDVARPGENPEQFSSTLTGEPEARPVIAAGSAVVNSAIGHKVWRVTGADVDGGVGYVDVAPRRAYAMDLGRIYRVKVAFIRAVDPVDPEGNGVEVRVQNLNSNKASVSNVRIGGAFSPEVADGLTEVVFTVSRDLEADYTPPSTARYLVPFPRFHGVGQSTDAVFVSWEDITDITLGGADVASLSARIGEAEDALDGKAPIDSPTFTGTVGGITKAMVGLELADNTPDTAKPISVPQQAAFDAATLERNILRSVQKLLSRSGVFPLGENSLGLVVAASDSKNRLLSGMRPSGTVYEAHVVREVLGPNSLDVVEALRDADGRIFWGVKRNGGYIAGGLVHDPLHENNLDLIGDVVVDADNRVLWAMTSDGTTIGYAASAGFFRRKEFFQLTGQSLAEGGANAAITVAAPYVAGEALRFENGPVGKQSEVIGPGLEHLAEEVNETICTGMARRILADHPELSLLMAGQAWGGKTIAEISLGAADGIYEKVQAQMDLAAALPGGAVIRAFGMINGEADGLIQNTNFDKDLETFRRQYALDAMTRLRQTEIPLLMTCQTSSVSGYKGDWAAARDSFPTPFLQLQAALTNPYIVLVGPKYQYTYVDHSHIDALSTRLHGEKYGQVRRHLFLDRRTWLPVHASSITRDNDAIILNLHSPVGMPIEVDTVSVLNPGNLGFNLLDAGSVTIGSVTQTGDFQITVECSANVPDASRLSYAFHNGTNPTSGWETGARGCIRDSDPTLSIYTDAAMPNWLCAFQHNF